MNNGKLATFKKLVKNTGPESLLHSRGYGTPPSTQTKAVVYAAQVLPQNYGIWVSLNQWFFSPFSQLCLIAKLTMNHKNSLAKFGCKPDLKVIKRYNPCIFWLLAGTCL